MYYNQPNLCEPHLEPPDYSRGLLFQAPWPLAFKSKKNYLNPDEYRVSEPKPAPPRGNRVTPRDPTESRCTEWKCSRRTGEKWCDDKQLYVLNLVCAVSFLFVSCKSQLLQVRLMRAFSHLARVYSCIAGVCCRSVVSCTDEGCLYHCTVFNATVVLEKTLYERADVWVCPACQLVRKDPKAGHPFRKISALQDHIRKTHGCDKCKPNTSKLPRHLRGCHNSLEFHVYRRLRPQVGQAYLQQPSPLPSPSLPPPPPSPPPGGGTTSTFTFATSEQAKLDGCQIYDSSQPAYVRGTSTEV